ncbi:MAG TPA: Ig-like domain-containing protein [Longimicrobiales bacterium]
MRKFIISFVLTAAAGCARVMAPSGGEQDQEAPRVVETEPEQGQMAMALADTDLPVRFVFHETISERSPREMVQVSPETGEVEVERDGNVLEVRIAGGWRAGRVYRVTVLPGIVDRRGNPRTTSYELVFSTGAPILHNAVGGIAVDRITGRPAVSARVEARLRSDTSTVYTGVTDSAGFFALRSLPAGDYTTVVYADQNRNRALDAAEARAATDVTIGATDTLALELALLPNDTTPARLLRAEIRDSMQVRLFFDDYMEGNASLTGIRVSAWQLPDSLIVGTTRVLTPRAFQTLRNDTTRVTSPRLPPADTANVLPINELVWIPQRGFLPNTRYRITVTGFTNLHGLSGGGGSVVVTSPAPPRATPAAPRDTTARRDTTSLR